MRRKQSPIDPRQQQYEQDKELQVLEQLEARVPPKKELSTNQLDNRSFPESFTRSATKGQTSERQKQELTRTLLDQIYLEREVEKIKQELAMKPDFNCVAAFELFDYCSRAALTKPQFAESLFSLIGHELYNRN